MCLRDKMLFAPSKIRQARLMQSPTNSVVADLAHYENSSLDEANSNHFTTSLLDDELDNLFLRGDAENRRPPRAGLAFSAPIFRCFVFIDCLPHSIWLGVFLVCLPDSLTYGNRFHARLG